MFRPILQRRVHGATEKAVAELAIGLAAGIGAVALRGLLLPMTGSTAPFALNFIGAALATLFAGWRAGMIAVASGQLLSWYVILEPQMSFRLHDPRDATALALATGALLFLVGIIGRYQHDVDCARAEAAREHELRGLLLFELKHRMKNTLSLVQSLAQQSFRNKGIDDVAEAYYRRLTALGQTHDLLTQCEWTGADIRQVIEQSLHPLVPNRERLTIQGPPLVLEPKACLNLALVFHELTTNSLKYGALSNGSGRVTVTWSNDPTEGFLLEWQEAGGPPVHAPKKHGFGTRLIERAMASELEATVRMDFAASGFSCAVKAPYFAPRASSAATEALASTEVHPGAIAQPSAV